MSTDHDRLARRTTALAQALFGLDENALADDVTVAAVCVAPGFRASSGDAAADPLTANRAARREAMTGVLSAVPTGARSNTARLADHLCLVREDLVHPMTEEPMSLLDWVNRGGDPSVAREHARTNRGAG